jgi:tetratricopeptide (TPR) repeat protein
MTEFLFDKAALALSAQRFDEAQQCFEKILEFEYSQKAWCGLGTCKIFQLAKGISLDEAFFCFNKAIDAPNSNRTEVQEFVTGTILAVMQFYTDYAVQSIQNILEAKKQQRRAIAISAASFLVNRNSSGTVKFVSGIATLASAGIALGKFSEIESEIEMRSFAVYMIEEAAEKCQIFLSDNADLTFIIGKYLLDCRETLFFALPQVDKQKLILENYESPDEETNELLSFLSMLQITFKKEVSLLGTTLIRTLAQANVFAISEKELIAKLTKRFESDESFLFILRDKNGNAKSVWTTHAVFVVDGFFSMEPNKKIHYQDINEISCKSNLLIVSPSKNKIEIGLKIVDDEISFAFNKFIDNRRKKKHHSIQIGHNKPKDDFISDSLCDFILIGAGPTPLNVIKALSDFDLSLKEAKRIVDNVPYKLYSKIETSKVILMKDKLEASGAIVKINLV